MIPDAPDIAPVAQGNIAVVAAKHYLGTFRDDMTVPVNAGVDGGFVAAVTNGLDEEDHMRIQRSIKNRYPITISMGVGAAETAHDAQRLATEALQREGGAQSSERKEILAIDSLVDPEDSFVQVAHIDINSVTETLTDIESAFDTSFMVNRAQHYLMTKLREHKALLFFIGGDNFMSPCNGLSEEEIQDILIEIDEEIGIGLKAGIGRSPNAEDSAYMADIGLEIIRDGNNEKWIEVVDKL